MGKVMRYLLAGHEPEDRIRDLLLLTDIRSEDLQDALVSHYSKGFPAKSVCVAYSIAPPNFSRGDARLNEVAGIVERIKERDWARFNYRLTDNLAITNDKKD
uniref:Putative transcription regulatory protein n=1 Tax=viral metagenome TaxID=1070528 RepID=A0A6M3KNL2_9ZZZZ